MSAMDSESDESESQVIKAIWTVHDSLVAQLQHIEDRLHERIHELQPKSRRSSEASLPVQSQSVKKLQVPKDNLALQVLQMDISHLKAPLSSRSLTHAREPRVPREREEALGALRSVVPTPMEPPPSLPGATGATESEAEPLAEPLGTTTTATLNKSSSLDRISSKPRRLPQGLSVDVLEVPKEDKEEEDPKSPRESKRRSSTLKLDRAVSKANLSEFFKVKEAELTATLSGRNSKEGRSSKKEDTPEKAVPQLPLDEKTVEEASDLDSQELEEEEANSKWLRLSSLNDFVAGFASKAVGLVPLFETDRLTVAGRCARLTSRLYHWLLILGLVYQAVDVALRIGVCRSEDCPGPWPPLAVDMIFLFGACLVLMSWGGLRNYEEKTELVRESVQDLTSFCDLNGLHFAWKIWSCSDALWAVLLWSFLTGGRCAILAWNKEAENAWTLDSVPFVLTFAVATGVLVLASFWQVRTSHAMLLIVNSWSAAVLRGGAGGCMRSKLEWKRVSGLFRKTSRAFEQCFAALAVTIVMLILSTLFDLRYSWDPAILASVSMALFLPGVLWTSASTTTACNRLPSLVLLCEAEDSDDDSEYIDLAMFLSLSECGFFVWDTCVTMGLVQKFLYFTAAISGTIAFQIGAFHFV